MKNETEDIMRYTAKGNKNNRIKDLVRELTYKPQHLSPRAKRKLKDRMRNLVQDLHYKPQHLNSNKRRMRTLRSKPRRVQRKRYVAKGKMKNKIKYLMLIAVLGVASCITSSAVQTDLMENKGKNTIDNIAIMQNEKLSDSGIIIQYENKELDKTLLKPSVVNYQNVVNKGESELETKQTTVEEDKQEREIKTVYGGEISASENGIRTPEEIIHAVTQIGWRESEIENVIEMMDGLLRMQRDFDIDPLCALSVFHHESMCGLSYEKYGQYRLANILKWSGQEGVIGYSKGGSYGLYNDYNSAVYDFGNYVRNSKALKGARTMADLESFNGYKCIFNGAATADANTYSKLKQCLEQEFSDIKYTSLDGFMTDDVIEVDGQQLLNSVTINENKLNSVLDTKLGSGIDTEFEKINQDEIYQLRKEVAEDEERRLEDYKDNGLRSQVETILSQEENSELSDDIKTIYGGEISASKNGMRTEDEILYAVTQMGWQEAEIENVVEMLDGLMRIQRDFDIDPLCALAVFHHESSCGLSYEKYGQHRLANILKWPGEKGVIGYSKSGSYGLYEDYNSAVYDFANYVRNSKALKGAKTMADLESFNGYGCIFNGAATADADTYNKLKQCLERDYSSEVNMDDILELVENCTTEELQEMTSTIKSSLQNENSRNKRSKGENSER